MSPWGKSYADMLLEQQQQYFGGPTSKDQIDQPEYGEVEDNAMMPPSSYPYYPPVSFAPGYMYGNNMYSAPAYNAYAHLPMDLMRYQQPMNYAQMGYQT